MQLLAHGTEQCDQTPFHGEVNILISQTGLKRSVGSLPAHRFKTLHQLVRLCRRDHPGGRKHACVGNRSVQVLLQEGQVKPNRRIEGLDERMKALFKPITPGASRTTGHATSHHAFRRCPQLVRPVGRRSPRATLGRFTASGTFNTTIEASSSN